MDGVVTAIYLVGALTSIAAFVLFFVARRRTRAKFLVWDASPPVPIAGVFPHREDYKLSLVYERADEPPMTITRAYVQFVQLANMGSEPIRSSDLLPSSDVLRVELESENVLDLSVAAVTRAVN